MYQVVPIFTKIPLSFYPSPPILVGGNKATYHQFDCLAAFYQTRSLQQTADLLGLTSKGVSSHLWNFRTDKETEVAKMSEGILCFLDSCDSDTREVLDLHYRHLLIEKAFKYLLKQVLRYTKTHKITCFLEIPKVLDEHVPLKQLKNHLELAGVEVIRTEEYLRETADYNLRIEASLFTWEESSKSNTSYEIEVKRTLEEASRIKR